MLVCLGRNDFVLRHKLCEKVLLYYQEHSNFNVHDGLE